MNGDTMTTDTVSRVIVRHVRHVNVSCTTCPNIGSSLSTIVYRIHTSSGMEDPNTLI